MKRKIAYLAPETFESAATYVYNEMLALEKHNFKVIPISVRQSNKLAQSPDLDDLKSRCYILYNRDVWSVIFSNLYFLIFFPNRYFNCLLIVIKDFLDKQVGIVASLKLFYQFIYASKLALFLKKTECQHLHIHFAHTPTQIGMYAVQLIKSNFTFTAHANDLFERGILLQEKVSRSMGTIVISEYNRQFIIKHLTKSDKIHIVRCSVDTDRYQAQYKDNLNAPFVIGSLGRLVSKKGMDDLIKAVYLLHQDGIACRLKIGGEGPLEGELKALARQYNLEEHIYFEGSIPHDHVPDWLKTLDIFVLACKSDKNSDRDGIPVVLMEAMATGIPVVSTKISGIPELISSNVSGMLAEPGDPSSVAEQIRHLIYLSGNLTTLTKQARQRVLEEFSQQVNIQRLIKVLEPKVDVP